MVGMNSLRSNGANWLKCTLGTALISVLLGAQCTIAMAEGAKTTMSADLLKHLDTDKFTEIRSLGDLPASVKAFYTKQSNVDDIKKVMAEAGKEFQAGCNQMPGGAPSKSFLVGAKSGSLCLVYYQSGGFVLLDTIDMFKTDAELAEKVWSSSMFKDKPDTGDELVKTARERVKNPVK